MSGYPHLTLQTTPNMMTNLGIPINMLDISFGSELDHDRNTPIGRHNGLNAWAVHPHWGFCSLTHQEIQNLIQTIGEEEQRSMEEWKRIPKTHLFSRLLNQLLPCEGETRDNRATYLIYSILRSNFQPFIEEVMFERQEAAHWAKKIHDHVLKIGVAQGHIPLLYPHIKTLIDFAVPNVLFQQSSHESMRANIIKANILTHGADALPDFLKAKHNQDLGQNAINC